MVAQKRMSRSTLKKKRVEGQAVRTIHRILDLQQKEQMSFFNPKTSEIRSCFKCAFLVK